MSDNGWPDKPGVPPNPEQGGWHWLKESDSDMECVYWIAKPWLGDSRGCWETVGTEDNFEPHEISNWHYISPCLKPEEAERLRKNFSMAEHEMKIADRNRIFFQKEYERWMNMSQELNDYTIKLEEAIFNYVNRVVSCEGVTFIDGLDDEWTSLICDVWTKQRKKVGDEDE
jgi:hypothetical protein